MKFPFDFWMYGVLEEALKMKLEKEMKSHTKDSYELLKKNKFDRMGATNLTLDRLTNLRDTHSLYAESLLFDAKLEKEKVMKK